MLEEQLEKQLKERHIRSFVRREGRMTVRQKSAMESLWEKYGISEKEPCNNKVLFPNAPNAPLCLEIGFGMGQSLLEMALANPNKNYIGVEVHRPGVGSLLSALHEAQISNLRVYAWDVVEILKACCVPEIFSEIHIYFPDPWPKAKHHKRRLIQKEFIARLLSYLKPEGMLYCATDWEHYAFHMMEVLSSFEQLKNTAGSEQFHKRERPHTKFEARGEKLGHQIYDLSFEKIRSDACLALK